MMVKKNKLMIVNNRWLIVVVGLLLLYASYRYEELSYSSWFSVAGLVLSVAGLYLFLKADK